MRVTSAYKKLEITSLLACIACRILNKRVVAIPPKFLVNDSNLLGFIYDRI